MSGLLSSVKFFTAVWYFDEVNLNPNERFWFD